MIPGRATSLPPCYRIRRKADGLYSGGEAWPGFTSRGKIWTTWSAVRAHLALVPYETYKDCVVEELILTHNGESPILPKPGRGSSVCLSQPTTVPVRHTSASRELDELTHAVKDCIAEAAKLSACTGRTGDEK